MQLYREPVLNVKGEPISGVEFTVKTSTGELATLFAEDGTPTGNPVVTNLNGEAPFKAANGNYSIDIAGMPSKGLQARTVAMTLNDPTENTDRLQSAVGSALVGWATYGKPLSSVQEALDLLYFGVIHACKYMTDAEKSNGRNNQHSINVTAKIQRVIDEAEPLAKTVFLPSGGWDVRDGLRFANSAKFQGENQRSAVLWGSAAAPTIGSKTGFDFNFCTFMDFSVFGGAHCFGITVSSETAFNKFLRIDTVASAGYDCYYFNKLMQTSLWDGFTTSGGNRGIACVGFTANSNVMRNGKMGNHAQAHIYLRGATLNTVFNVTHEGGGVMGQAVYDIDNSIGFNVSQCAYENVHQYILKETTSTNTTTFDKCDFIYAVGGTPLAFASDGYVEFGTNTWYLPSDGPAKMRITGYNSGKLGIPSSKIVLLSSLADNEFSSGTRAYPSGGQQDLIRLDCGVPDNALTRLATLRGTLTVNYESINTGGAANIIFSRTYKVMASSRGGLALIGSVTLKDSDDTLSGGSTLTVGIKAGTTPGVMVIEANFASMAPTAGQSIFSWHFKSHCAASDIVTYIIPSLP